MKKAVSLKVCLARTAGLLVLAAVAVAFLATPMIAIGAPPKAPNTLPKAKFQANFVGLVDAPLPTKLTFEDFKVGNTAFKLTLIKEATIDQFKKGAWLIVDIKDTTGQSYGFFATVDSVNKGKQQIKALLGSAARPEIVSDGAVKLFQGKLVFLKFNTNPTNAAKIVAIPPEVGTGWDLPPA